MPKNKRTSSVTPLNANRYFAVEALKRSKKMKKYSKESFHGSIICAKLRIPKGAFEGNNHEQYLSASSLDDPDDRGLCNKNLDFYDLKIFARTPRSEPMFDPPRDSLEAYIRYPTPDPEGNEEIDGEEMVLALIRDPNPKLLCLALPMLEKPSSLLKLLKPFLKIRHAEATKAQKGLGTVAREERTKNYFEDISAWRRNIQCYDLADAGATHKEIVSKIYPNAHSVEEHKKAIDGVKSAIWQVKNMIASAENGIWPPRR